MLMYEAYDLERALWSPVQAGATVLRDYLGGLPPAISSLLPVRQTRATATILARPFLTPGRPAFSIDEVLVGKQTVAVEEQPVVSTPFATLLHFTKVIASDQPKVLVVAPLAGHFATILRDTVRTLLSDHDVYVIDWHNARDIPLDEGRFGLDPYIDHVISFTKEIGGDVHLLAVCQPCVPVLAAVAVLAQEGSSVVRSMTLMAGPIDARVSPTKVNELAVSMPLSWFKKSVLAHVPSRYRGAGRLVYPGFIQLSAFMQMNVGLHLEALWRLFSAYVSEDIETADATEAFYDEYFAVLDLDADFYLETIDQVFQRYALAEGTFHYQGAVVQPQAIRKTALLTVEGERDDICGMGQTLAAHDLCTGIRPHLHRHHLQVGAGHYGVFSGHRWREQIYPVVKSVIAAAS